MPSSTKAEDVEAKYDVSLNYPNLELHSAAASGNVGLVHYALTHGQPVNSVLHGVLPLHAACSGGSVSVVKMLIDRGADVNAPRLPRRYSEGKKTNVPSIGAAGSTPLHFAAANGHAAIAQILLTCGAIHNKMDKNGMTPEALAEINGHTEVIRVLRVWEHLKATDPAVASLAPSEANSEYGPPSPMDDESRFLNFGSRKGKERTASFASNVSDSTTGAKIKHSLEGFLKGRSSRSGSFASTRADAPKLAPLTVDGSAVEDRPSAELSPLSSLAPSDRSDHGATFDRAHTAGSVGSEQVPPPAGISAETEVFNDPPRASISAELGPSPSRHNPSTSGSSRRPSLPSIFEKAVHPGAAFKAALRRDHHRPPPIQTDAPSLSSDNQVGVTPSTGGSGTASSGIEHTSHGHSIFRGRARSNESSGQSKHAHRYMSKHALVSLFKRSHSPPSRSPSPPRRTEPTKAIDPDQMEENMEKMRRASLDLDLRDSGSTPTVFIEEPDIMSRLPASAPPTQTSFFTGSIAPPIPSPNPAFIPLPASPVVESPRERLPPLDRRGKVRLSSEVISPSPLSNEWAGSSDSDTPSAGIRRAKTEYIRPTASSSSQHAAPRSALQSYRSTPPSPLRTPGTRTRAVTSPPTPVGGLPMRSASGTKLIGLGWNEAAGLRKVASLRRESKKQLELEERLQQVALRADTEDEDEVFHDPEDGGDDSTPEESQVTTAQSRVSDETEKGDNESGYKRSNLSLEVCVTEPSPVEAVHSSKSSVKQGRYRGASIGSVSATTESSRISSPPGSSGRLSSLPSDDEPKSPTHPYPPFGYADVKHVQKAPSSDGGRTRGKSVSSTSSAQTDMSVSYFLPSTPGTSLTPQSTLSMPGGRFPPVPEHGVAHHPSPRRKVSNRQEARQAKKQAEDDVLQLAQLPPSLDSTRSLAAQLAAYGESLEVEEEFAKRERKWRGSIGGDGDTGGSDSESYFSARSDVESMRGSRPASAISSSKSKRKAVPALSAIPPDLLPADAPKSSIKSINSIYDKRAAAYRDRMAALTALPPTFSTALSSSASSSRQAGHRAVSIDSWSTAGSSSRRPGSIVTNPEADYRSLLSTPQPVKASEKSGKRSISGGQVANSVRQASTKTAPSIAPSASIARSRVSSGSRSAKPPAPIADVVQTRYAGMSPPPNVPQPPRLDPSSPFKSIFSHRYTGSPHDGDDSDDEEQQVTNLTVIENDWRGGKSSGASDESFERKGRWGQFKGAIGHIGHRKATH